MKQFITIAIFGTLFCTAAFAGTPPNENFNLGGSKKGLTIMPNPATGDAQILFVSGKELKAKVKVYDASGKLVLNQDNQLTTGKNKINIDNFIQLEEGNYSIRLIAGNKIYSSTFVLWK